MKKPLSNYLEIARRAAAALALLSLLAFTAQAETTEADRRLAQLQGWLDETRTLAGSFEQELLSGAFGTGMEESGRFALERPGKIRFEYVDPEHKISIVNGRRTYFWVAEDDDLMVGEIPEEGDLLGALLIQEQPLEPLFEASIDVEPTRRGRFRLRLVPREEQETLTELIVTARSDSGAIEAVEVLDAAGNRVLYRFPKVRRNRPLEAELFTLESGAVR